MYAQDSFFTLTIPGQIGLALLSTVLAAITIWVAMRLMRGRRLVLRILWAFACWAAFIWLAPQVYYTYYIFLLDGLPWQVVIKAPPDPVELLRILTFTERANLSFHAQGALGWLLLVLAVLRR